MISSLMQLSPSSEKATAPAAAIAAHGAGSAPSRPMLIAPIGETRTMPANIARSLHDRG